MTTEAMLRELEKVISEVDPAKPLPSWDKEGKYRNFAAAKFINDHGPALLEAVRDAERYRYLRKYGINYYTTGILPDIVWQGPNWLDINGPESLDEAIDQARAEGGE